MLYRLKTIYPPLIEVLWSLVYIGLPLTSFPILGWMTNSQAAPFSAIPIGLLIILWFIPQIIHGKELPLEVIPILGFVLAAIFSSAGIYYLNVIHYEGRTFLDQSIRGLFTLGIGLSFYLVSVTWLKDVKFFRRALQWIHIGGAIMLLWGLIQTIIIFTRGGQFPTLLEKMRVWLVISTSAVREGTRLTSLAYEPSWFAHQLNILYLPLWLAATYLKQSVFRFRLLHFSVENIFLFFALFEFFLSRPRVGMAAFLLVIAFLLLKITLTIINKLSRLILSYLHIKESKQKLPHYIINIFIGITMTGLYIGLALLLVYIGSKFDKRLALLFVPVSKADLSIIMAFNENALLYFGQRLQFLERVIYWLLGWHVFGDYPIFGVGLGNTGFFVTSHIPPVGWATTEFRNLVFRFGYMVNTKSYWIRILAETGLVGLSFFLTWLAGLWRSARFLMHSQEKLFLLIGLAGQLMLVAFIIEGFSLDSFALPYLWIIAAFISAARMVATQNKIATD
ncbi:MAG: hypothetical protein WBV22_08010 [Anaerolineaceae bacterium]